MEILLFKLKCSKFLHPRISRRFFTTQNALANFPWEELPLFCLQKKMTKIVEHDKAWVNNTVKFYDGALK